MKNRVSFPANVVFETDWDQGELTWRKIGELIKAGGIEIDYISNWLNNNFHPTIILSKKTK